MKLIDKELMLNKLIRLNLTLFNEIRKYAYDNGVPLSFSPSILRLVNEIQKTDVECFPPNENLQHQKPNKEFTESLFIRLIFMIANLSLGISN